MHNNYKNIITLTLLTLIGVFGVATATQAATYKNGYSVWVYYATNPAGMSAELKSFLRADAPVFWNSGEPNNSGEEDCAVQQQAGGWNDLKCDANDQKRKRHAACFNGASWVLSTNYSNDESGKTRSSAIGSCPAGYVFAAPTTQAQRSALSAIIAVRGGSNANSSSSGDVWINADDTVEEGVWRYNTNTNSVIMPKWAAGHPVSAQRCAEVTNTGDWKSASCTALKPVICANQEFTAANIITTPTAFSSVSALNQLCKTTYGEQWNFAAPSTIQHNNSVKNIISSAAQTSAWVNAQSLKFADYWQSNDEQTNWASGEPNINNGQCAVARQSDGKWQMVQCDSSARLLCSDGDSWVVRNAVHQFANQALEACSRPDTANSASNPYLNYRLKTPVTAADLDKATTAVRAAGNGTLMWLNLKYIQDTGAWLTNESYSSNSNGSNFKRTTWFDLFNNKGECESGSWRDYDTGANLTCAQGMDRNLGMRVYFAPSEPNDSGACVQLYSGTGMWDDTPCNNSKRVACFNGFDWKVSVGAVTQGNESEQAGDLNNAQNACALLADEKGVVGNYRFAAPTSFNQSQNLQMVAIASGAGDIWVNANDKRYNRTFVFNLGVNVVAPFWGANEPNDAGGNEDCATQSSNGSWNDVNCAALNEIACYDPFDGNNGLWKLTAAKYAFTTPLLMSNRCETEFGGPYKFYAPTTLSQKADLLAVMSAKSLTAAYINANDQQYEGSWKYNTDINNWAQGQPSASTMERCVSANASSSQWSSRSCANNLPVACSTGSRWDFTSTPVNLTEFANGEKACRAAFGQGYLFAAPRTLDDAMELQQSANNAGLGGNFWINGNRLEDFATWMWNATNLSTPVWGNGQPSGGASKNCAVLNNNTEASWQDAACNSASNFAYLCRNGTQWQISTVVGNLNDFSIAVSACAALGNGWVFAAPTSYNENLAAKNAMAGQTQVWLNATDAVKEGAWLLNSAPINTYPQWGNTSFDNCMAQDASGKINTANCSGSAENSWACTNGFGWKVTKSQGRIGKFADGHKACVKEYGSAFVFAAPLNMNDAIQLDFARLLAAAERSSPIPQVWLNMTTSGITGFITDPNGRQFRRNLPFSNWLGKVAGEEPSVNVCAFKASANDGADNPWRTQSCTGNAAHYACTNGSNWKIALAKGALVDGVLQNAPQVGVDYWSYERGTSLCKAQFGSAYTFSAPITAAEELALDAAIRVAETTVKNVWINYYAVNALVGVDSIWFANRLKLGIWQDTAGLYKNYNNSDCALLHKDGSYTNASCSTNSNLTSNQNTYPFACFDGAWQINGNGYWNQGFAVCDSVNNSLFAVPRTPDELVQLQDAMGAAPAVWINLTDTANEGQWIANRLRFAWWSTSEPDNQGNKDCARVRKADGQWYAGKCTLEAAPFACRSVAPNTISWNITTSTGVWHEGFGACAREFPGSEFVPPEGYGGLSATADQLVLTAIMANATKDAWINLSDQDSEGSWRAFQAYSDWGINTLFDQNADCAFIDRQGSGNGNWYADSCKYTAGQPISRGYSCTNGQQWKVVAATPSTTMHWSEGFAACQALGIDWRFGAPANDVQNRQLLLAMELLGASGVNQVWLNAHDRVTEGQWQINGGETNFAPDANTTATALVVAENTADLTLSALLTDDEEQGVASAVWSLVSNVDTKGVNHTDITVSANTVVAGANGSATVTAKYSTPVLFKEDRLLTFKLTATDIPPGAASAATSETFVNVRVAAPLIAAWDFNDAARPHLDTTGHGYDILTTTMGSATIVTNAARMNSASALVVNGKAADPVNGLDFSPTEYTIAFRISIEEANTGVWRGILQKGNAGTDRQPGLFLSDTAEQFHSSNSTNQSNNRAANTAAIPLQQWLNVVYVKKANRFELYVDGQLVAFYDFAAGEAALANTGNLTIGAVPGASESFTGLIDDIQVYNRVLSGIELAQVLPQPPLGTVQFSGASDTVAEYLVAPSTYAVSLERTRGNNAALTVYVDVDTVNSTATKGTLANMVSASHPADFAFVNEANYVASKGIPVSWAAGERGVKQLQLKLDNADDAIREGTEVARFVINDLGGANVGSNKQFDLRFNDLTPNPYGNFTIGVKAINGDLLAASMVLETKVGSTPICIRRESGTTGDVTVNYQIGGNAVAGTGFNNGDFEYLASGEIPSASTGSILFADAGSSEQCFDIGVFNNPAIGSADKVLSIAITGLNHAPALEPLLSEQQQANLVIRDYAPGEFGFVTNSFSCYETLTSKTNLPVGVTNAATGNTQCSITVARTNVGGTAPAASLTLTASPAGGSYFSMPTTLNWPEISAAQPRNPALETQTIVVAVTENDIQNNDWLVTFGLTANAGEVLQAGATSADLTIHDVTSPALVQIVSVVPATANEGDTAVYTITRSGNLNTFFSLDYVLDVQNKQGGNTDDHYVNTGTSSPLTGTVNFSIGGTNTQTLSFKTINTVENNDNITVNLKLFNPSNTNVVGLGQIANAGGDIGQGGLNKTNKELLVQNTRDSIQNNYSVKIKDLSSSSESGYVTERSYAYNNGVVETGASYLASRRLTSPLRRKLALSFIIPAGLHIDEAIQYEWKLLNSNGDPVSWSDGKDTHTTGEFSGAVTGVATYDAFGAQSTTDLVVGTELTVPFVLNDTDFRVRLVINGNNESNLLKAINLTVKPLYRQLHLTSGGNNDYCLAHFGRGECIGNGVYYEDTRWAWNESNNTLINMGQRGNTNRCFYINGVNSEVRDCNGAIDPISLKGNNFELGIGDDIVCSSLEGFTYKFRRRGSCAASGDRNWQWREQ